jgi:hypothetical protein
LQRLLGFVPVKVRMVELGLVSEAFFRVPPSRPDRNASSRAKAGEKR